MKAIKETLAGIGDYGRAHRALMRGGLWRFLLVPGLLALIYFPALAVLAFAFRGEVVDFITSLLGSEWIDRWRQEGWAAFLLEALVLVALVLGGALLFRTVAMILFSPFLGYMSEEVERREAGREPAPFTWRGAGADALRGSLLALATTALSLFALVLCFALEAIPLVGTVGGLVLAPVFQGFFAGMNFFDPPLERRRLRVGESLRFLWRTRWRLVANGLVFLALLAIPVVGWFLAPGYAALAGTIGSLRRLREDGIG